MARHTEPEMRTVSAVKLIAIEAAAAAKEIELLCEMLESDKVFAFKVKFFETASKGNTHLRSFSRAIREAMQNYRQTGEGVVRQASETDAEMIARVSAEIAKEAAKTTEKPKRNSNKKSG